MDSLMCNCTSKFSLREPRNDDGEKRPGSLPAFRLCITGSRGPYFASARFGGVAGHDFTSVS